MLACGCDDYDSVEFETTGTRTARKQHVCEECAKIIQPGETYWRSTFKQGGDFFDVKRCERCSDLWAALEDLGFCTFTGGVLQESYREYLDEYAGGRWDEERDELLLPNGRTVDEQMTRVFA